MRLSAVVGLCVVTASLLVGVTTESACETEIGDGFWTMVYEPPSADRWGLDGTLLLFERDWMLCTDTYAVTAINCLDGSV